MALKDVVPFAAKHRLKAVVGRATTLPQHLASGSVTPRGRVHAAYRRWYRTRSLALLLRPLLAPGDLVFDVGANVGAWTEALRALGFRVVAVEPQPSCADAIRRQHEGDAAVAVVAAAVGAERGEQPLHLAGNTEHATTSNAWMEAMVERGGWQREQWGGTLDVPVRTLDDLAHEFGTPAYVKLDIEGSEADALRGLTSAVGLISFETHGQTPEKTEACVTRLRALGDYEFNLGPGEFPRLAWGEWRRGDAVLRTLAAEPSGWSNVFARLRR
jgi:FkbM family methyltransferase